VHVSWLSFLGVLALTVQTFPIRALTTVVPLVEVVIRPALVINRVTHVHVSRVSIAELAVVPLGSVRRGIRPVIEGSANDDGNPQIAVPDRPREQTLSFFNLEPIGSGNS